MSKKDEEREHLDEDTLARMLYRRSMIVDRWDEEQDAILMKYLNEAQRILAMVKNAGYEIVKRQESK